MDSEPTRVPRTVNVVLSEGTSLFPLVPVAGTGDWDETISVIGWGGDRLILGGNGSGPVPFFSGKYMFVQEILSGIVVRVLHGDVYYVVPQGSVQF
ncbi:MAG: hypothetical protein ABIE03_06600 [Patescibacteria group bacterium]|nr:hypothetical protein [Patescibacteria group bacterium]